jgi:hypothetical protein
MTRTPGFGKLRIASPDEAPAMGFAVDGYLAKIKAMSEGKRIKRMALFAALPCGGCDLHSVAMRQCEQSGNGSLGEGDPGCKHAPALEREREIRELHRDRKARLASAGIASPSPLVLGEPEGWPSLLAVRKVIDAPGIRWLVLSGGPGTGKTIAAHYALSRRSGLFATAGDLARPRPLDASKGWSTEDARSAALLVVDDMGIEPRTDYAAAQVEEIICGREYSGLTILTTNKTEAEFMTIYGDRFRSRIKGRGGIWQTCTGGDGREGAKSL